MANALAFQMPQQPDPMPEWAKAPNATAVAPASIQPAAPKLPKPNPLGQIAKAMAPRRPSVNALGTFLDTFQRVYDPKAAQARDGRMDAESEKKLQQGLAFAKQLRMAPAEGRAGLAQQGIQQFGFRDLDLSETGLSDSALDQDIAMLSSHLGISPATPEQYTLAPGARRYGAGGQVVAENPAAETNKPTVINNRVVDPNDPSRVIADYSDAPKPANWQTTTIGDRVVAYDPSDPTKTRDMGPAPPKGGDGGISADLLYRMERDRLKDEKDARDRGLAEGAAVSNLKDGQQRVADLMGHKGFDGIYGPFGAFGVNMGAKPTNVMNQDELNAMALLDQVGGEAFLAGVQKMRGTGPLSDNEGKRVSAAVTRLTNRLQSPEAARAAAVEFSSAMKALEQAYTKESGGADMPDEVESSGIFDDVAQGGGSSWINQKVQGAIGKAMSASDLSDDELRAQLGLE